VRCHFTEEKTMAAFASYNSQIYLDRQSFLWNSIVIVYSLLAYTGSLLLLINNNILLNIIGLIFLTHSLIYSAYLSHEFMHGTIFKSCRWNKEFGKVMLWLNGGCYYGFQILMIQHIAHHVKRVDVFTFDIPVAIQGLPSALRLIIVALEWCYFPIVSFWSRWRSIIIFWKNSQSLTERIRIFVTFIFRGFFFALLGLVSIKALLLYFLAYIGMITCLRFMDAFQHTYEAFPPGTKLPKRDYNYEQNNTFSNLISYRHSWLNLLFLNFGYHNAHHADMKCPWYKLQKLDRELFDKNNNQRRYINILKQLINYHKFRTTRLFTGQGEVFQDKKNDDFFSKFYGAADVSFLTLY
jgi:fatty acid desaturase